MISVGVECEHICSKWNSICVRSEKVFVENACMCRKWMCVCAESESLGVLNVKVCVESGLL